MRASLFSHPRCAALCPTRRWGPNQEHTNPLTSIDRHHRSPQIMASGGCSSNVRQVGSWSPVAVAPPCQLLITAASPLVRFHPNQAIAGAGAVPEPPPAKLKLYSFWRSSCSQRVRIALNLKGIYTPAWLCQTASWATAFRSVSWTRTFWNYLSDLAGRRTRTGVRVQAGESPRKRAVRSRYIHIHIRMWFQHRHDWVCPPSENQVQTLHLNLLALKLSFILVDCRIWEVEPNQVCSGIGGRWHGRCRFLCNPAGMTCEIW